MKASKYVQRIVAVARSYDKKLNDKRSALGVMEAAIERLKADREQASPMRLVWIKSDISHLVREINALVVQS